MDDYIVYHTPLNDAHSTDQLAIRHYIVTSTCIGYVLVKSNHFNCNNYAC